jgi:hypothetical protein
MKAFALYRKYLYGNKLIAIVEGESNAQTLCEKWNCEKKLISAKLWAELQEKL